MPKARKRKNSTVKKSSGLSQPASRALPQANAAANPLQPANRAFISPAVKGPQSLIAPALVALGCWGLSFSFLFFSTVPNHLLYGGMAVIMALMWSFSFGTRARKLYMLRQRAQPGQVARQTER